MRRSTKPAQRPSSGGIVDRYAPIQDVGGMYTVKALDPSGREMRFACGTDEQALEKTWELAGRGFRVVRVIDPQGKEWSAMAFEQALGIDGD